MVRFLGVTALALVVGLSGCGGSTKTVVQTVTASANASTSSAAAATVTASTPTGPRPCQDMLRAQNIRPTVCELPNGTFLKAATENYPVRLKSLTIRFVGAHTATSVSDPSGVASATANGTFEILTLRVTNDSNTPQRAESIGGDAFALETIATNKTYTESFQAENQADPSSFVSQNTAPIQPDASQTGDIVFDLPASGLATIRSSGAGLLFGEFGTDLSTASPSNSAGHPFGFLIIHHIKLQG